MLTSLALLGMLMLPPLALGCGCLWVAFQIVREAKQAAQSPSLESQPQFQGRSAYAVAGLLTLFGVVAVLLPPFVMWSLYTLSD